MDKPISTLMTTPVVTVSAESTVAAVSEEMRWNKLAFVPVMEDHDILGVISASDLLQFQLSKRDPTSVRVWEICSYKPIEVSPDTPISEVARQMVARRIHHVIVVESDEMKGIVSSLDFVKQFMV